MRLSLVLPILLPALGLGCRSQPFGEIDRANAREHLEQAEADLRAGEYGRALEHLAAINDVGGLEPDLRAREQDLIDEAARLRFEQLVEAPTEEFEDLFRSELPERVRARAGILAAERMLAEDRRISAFRMIKKVDGALPGHPERILAGDVLARAGLSLVRDRRRYYLIFHYRPRGVQALEYLVVNYPLEPRCPEAYFALSEVYEEEGDLDQAIERSEDLLLYHPESPYATGASARLPYLRLCRLTRDDYDRSELLRAEGELGVWLDKHPQHELRPWVEDLLAQCRVRLVRNDLILARFYAMTGVEAGLRWHAGRAREQALERGFEAEADEARQLLAGAAPELEAAPSPTPPPSEP